MGRTLKEYIIIGLKGMAMGAADVVPGVSGGTIAFISGIYEELLATISNINIGVLQVVKKEGIKKAWIQLNGNFLAALFVGILVSVVSLAKIIAWLLEKHPILVWSFFFGLVVASIIYVAKQIPKHTIISILLLLAGAGLAYYITTLSPMVSENSSLLFLFLAGALAICAMILPGVSGSFILVLLGAYKPVLEAITTKNFLIITTVAAGTLVGLLTFSRVLKWLFLQYKNNTLAVLTGCMVGSLNKIWPWKKVLTYSTNSHGEQVPFNELSVFPTSYEGNPQLIYAILLALIGFAVIILLEKIAVKKQ